MFTTGSSINTRSTYQPPAEERQEVEPELDARRGQERIVPERRVVGDPHARRTTPAPPRTVNPMASTWMSRPSPRPTGCEQPVRVA